MTDLDSILGLMITFMFLFYEYPGEVSIPHFFRPWNYFNRFSISHFSRGINEATLVIA